MSEGQQVTPIGRSKKSVSQNTIPHPANKDGSSDRQSPPPKKARLKESMKDDTIRYACRWKGCETSEVPLFSTIDQLREHCEAHFRENEEETLPRKNRRTQQQGSSLQSPQMASNETIQPKDALQQQTVNLANQFKEDIGEDITVDSDSNLCLEKSLNTLHLHDRNVVSNLEPPNEISTAAVLNQPSTSSENLSSLSKIPHDLLKCFTKHRGDLYEKLKDMRKAASEHNGNDLPKCINTEHGKLTLMRPEFTRSHIVSGDTSKEVNGQFYLDIENSMMFTSEIIAVFIPADTDKIFLKIRWFPEGYIDDEWIDHGELSRKIMQLIPHRFTNEMEKLQHRQSFN